MDQNKFVEVPVMFSMNLLQSSEELPDLLARFNSYGNALKKFSGGSIPHLIMVGGFSEETQKIIESLKLDSIKILRISNPTRNFLKFSFLAKKKLKDEEIFPKFILPADLYFNFLGAIILKKILLNQPKVQISIHGRVSRLQDSKLKALVRKNYLRAVFFQSDSLRFVSSELSREISEQFSLVGKKNIISPVPIPMPDRHSNDLKNKNIVFLGRIHAERGIDEWVSTIVELSKLRNDFTIRIIGDGPLFVYMKNALALLDDSISCEFHGSLPKSRVYELLHDAKILLSTAQSEGYGLALRESLISGVFVCAYNSKGAESLECQFPRLVYTFNSREEAISLLSQLLDDHFPIDLVPEVRAHFESVNMASLEELVRSWLAQNYGP